MKIEEIKTIIKYSFKDFSDTPSRVFKILEGLLFGFESVNIESVKSVDPSIEIKFYLEKIESSSIIINILKKILTPDEDDTLAIPEVEGNVPEFVTTTQDIITEKLAEHKEIPITNDIINEIATKIDDKAEDTGVNKSSNYRKINKIKIAEQIETLSTSLDSLNENEKIILPYKDKGLEINKIKTKLSIKSIKEELTERIIENEVKQILMIKIVDFLGKTKWKFKCGDTTIDAKINDITWLTKFHKKEDLIGPGDSILAKIIHKDYYDKAGNRIDTDYIIKKVIEIKRGIIQDELKI